LKIKDPAKVDDLFKCVKDIVKDLTMVCYTFTSNIFTINDRLSPYTRINPLSWGLFEFTVIPIWLIGTRY